MPEVVAFCRAKRRGLTVCVLATATCCLLYMQIGEAGLASDLRAAADELEYNLDYDRALELRQQAVVAAPNDPATYRALAATYLLEIGFRRGAVTVDSFLTNGATQVDRYEPAPELARGFRANADRALALAERAVRERPNDADAHYQLAATIALVTSYSATVDGRLFQAVKAARRAYAESVRALKLDPRRRDAALIIGTYQYVVSTLSFPTRLIARFLGFGANKARAIRMVEEAAQEPGTQQTDARLALVLIYNGERRFDEALEILRTLQARYPRNRLLWLEAGATAYRVGRFAEAETSLNEGFLKLATDRRARSFGEEALWHYKRGAVRLALGRRDEAAVDLRQALTMPGRKWVYGRAHSEIGKLADLAGDRSAARREYRVAVQLANSDNDDEGMGVAKQLLDVPYEPPGDGSRSDVAESDTRSPR